MTATHAQIARHLTAQAPPGVLARGLRDLITHGDSITLERMLPGVRFASRKIDQDEWEVVGTCEDGSTIVWRAGA